MQGKVEALRCKIMAEIKNGTLPVNAKIPSRNQLVRKYGFSRSTVDRTISMLTAEGRLGGKRDLCHVALRQRNPQTLHLRL